MILRPVIGSTTLLTIGIKRRSPHYCYHGQSIEEVYKQLQQIKGKQVGMCELLSVGIAQMAATSALLKVE